MGWHRWHILPHSPVYIASLSLLFCFHIFTLTLVLSLSIQRFIRPWWQEEKFQQRQQRGWWWWWWSTADTGGQEEAQEGVHSSSSGHWPVAGRRRGACVTFIGQSQLVPLEKRFLYPSSPSEFLINCNCMLNIKNASLLIKFFLIVMETLRFRAAHIFVIYCVSVQVIISFPASSLLYILSSSRQELNSHVASCQTASNYLKTPVLQWSKKSSVADANPVREPLWSPRCHL